MKSVIDILKEGDIEELDRILQKGFRQPGGAGAEVRRGNLIERLTETGMAMEDAFELCRAPRADLDGKSYLDKCHTHEGWLEVREGLGLGRPADA